MNRDNHYEAAFEAFLRARRLAVHRRRRSAAQPGRRRLAQEPRLHRLAARADLVARRCEGPPLSLRRRAPSVLEELVDARRPAQPGRLADALRRRLLPAAGVRLPPGRPAARRCRASSSSSSAATTTASSASGWPTTCRTPGRSPTAGTRSPCRPACSAARPARSTTGWPARCSPCPFGSGRLARAARRSRMGSVDERLTSFSIASTTMHDRSTPATRHDRR